jgi:hypothetical protein
LAVDRQPTLSERIARKPDQNGRKAGDVVTGQTCETPAERLGGWKPAALGLGERASMKRALILIPSGRPADEGSKKP